MLIYSLQQTVDRFRVYCFKYQAYSGAIIQVLGEILSSTDYDYEWPAVEWNLKWAREKWGGMVMMLGREWVDKRMAGKLFVAVVLQSGAFVWFRDLCGDSLAGEGPRELPPPGGPADGGHGP